MKSDNFSKNIHLFMILGIFLSIMLSFSLKTEPKTHNVEMVDMKFVPSKITVKKGDSVKFTNKSNIMHNVVIKDLDINSKFLTKGQSVIVKVDEKGNFEFYCLPHRTMNMKGTIISE